MNVISLVDSYALLRPNAIIRYSESAACPQKILREYGSSNNQRKWSVL